MPFETRCAGHPNGPEDYSLCGTTYDRALALLDRYIAHGACVDSDPIEKFGATDSYLPAVTATCGSLRVVRLMSLTGGGDAYFDDSGQLVTLDDYTDAYSPCPTAPRVLTAWYRMGPPHRCDWTHVQSRCPTHPPKSRSRL